MACSDDSVGDRIRIARQKRGLSQEELARAVDVRGQTIWRYEHNRMEPRTMIAAKIASVLQVSLEWLTYSENQATPDSVPSAYYEFLETPEGQSVREEEAEYLKRMWPIGRVDRQPTLLFYQQGLSGYRYGTEKIGDAPEDDTGPIEKKKN